MKMNGLVIGIGAAGNKAVINAIEKGVIEAEDAMLINSTLNDIPAKYKDSAYILAVNTGGGCGKERTKSKDAILEDLKLGRIPVKQKIENAEHGYSFIAIASSTEGGTGSGAATMLALYAQNVIKLPVHLFGFTGFASDPRGLWNTMEYFEDLTEGVIMHLIRNDRFLAETKSRTKAEIAANDEFVTSLNVIQGQLIVESTQNIDPRDLYKVVNTPGYEVAEYLELDDKIRNKSDFESALTRMCDESHAMETSPSMLRLAVIINVNENSQIYCEDYNILKERYGKCFEIYEHRQSEPGGEYIAFIASGMKMPMDEVKAIYQSYAQESDAVDKSEDDFFSKVKSMKGNPQDAMFTMGTVAEINSGSEDDFFAKFVKKGDSPKVTAPAVNPVEEY